jgi:general secretion pathway protein B
MSILLEALKKSEQERERGKTPTLQTQSEGPAGGQSSLNPWILLSMIVVSAGVMTWFGWQQFRLPESGEAATAVVEAANETAGPEAGDPAPRTLTESFQADSTAAPAPAGESPGAESADDSMERARLSQSVSNYQAEPGELEVVAEEVAETSVAEATAVADADLSPPQAAANPAEQEADQRAGLGPHVSEPISYWELPQGIRDDLPEIRITVLVYAEQPNDRFLLSNGQRLVEKDQLDGGLVLDEIRRDGAVFLYRNYRFLVKG